MSPRTAVVLVLAAAVVAVVAVLARPEGEPPRQPAEPVAGPRFEQHADRIVVSNDDGEWTVYTRCLGPSHHGGRDVTVGPGYVARLVAADGTVLVDDRREPGTLNDTDFGGLGSFGWHHSRGRPGELRFTGENAWEVSGRACAEDNGGNGVASAVLSERPRLRRDDRGRAFVGFAVDARFSDAATFPAPLLRARYRYRAFADSVEAWIALTQLCGDGLCGDSPGRAFVKEPKLVAHLRAAGPLPYRRTAVFDDRDELVCSFAGGGGPEGPILSTNQCDAERRHRLRFDAGEQRGCADSACLDVVMRAARASGDDVVPGGPTFAWQNGAHGLDAWAVVAGGRPRAFRLDTPSLDGVVWDCHGGDPAAGRLRRWETTGRLRADGRYRSLGALFPAWEGGRGGYDCEPLARVFGAHGETFAVFASYSLTAGPPPSSARARVSEPSPASPPASASRAGGCPRCAS